MALNSIKECIYYPFRHWKFKRASLDVGMQAGTTGMGLHARGHFQYERRSSELPPIQKKKRRNLNRLRQNKQEEQKRRNVPITHSTDEDDHDRNLKIIDIGKLVMEAACEDKRKQSAASDLVVRLLTSSFMPIQELIDAGILPVLVRSLDNHENPDLQFEAAWSLTNIASGTSAQTHAVVSAGAIEPLINIVNSRKDLYVCEQAVWALANIIGDCPGLRDLVIQLKVMDALLGLITHRETHKSCLHTIIWFIANVCHNVDPPPNVTTIKKILLALNILFHHDNVNILEDSVGVLIYIINLGSQEIQMVIDSEVLPNLIPLLSHKEVKVQTAALRAVGNILTGTKEQVQFLLNCDILFHFHRLLTHREEMICKEAAWVLSNLFVGNQAQVQAAIDEDLLPKLIINLTKSEFQIQREAAWAISNLTMCGSREQVARLVQEGVIPPFCNLLACKDPQVIQIVLNGINNMLKKAGPHVDARTNMIKKCGGFNKIQKLLRHENVDIYILAHDIIEDYFSQMDKTEDTKPPSEDEDEESSEGEASSLIHSSENIRMKRLSKRLSKYGSIR